MNPLPLPPNDLPALAPLVNGTLWADWAKAGRVFPLPSFRGAVHYLRLKPFTSCRIVVFAEPDGTDPPRGFLLYLYADLDRAATSLAKGNALCRWPGQGNLYYGLTLMAAGDASGAERQLTAGLAEHPSFEGYLALAEIQIDQGKFEGASRNLTIVEDCRPIMAFRFQTAYLRGLAELRQGNHEEARLRWNELLKIDSANHRAWLALGYLEILGERPEQARNCYSRALEIIDGKIRQSAANGSHESTGSAVRLKTLRQTAIRALESVP